MTKNNVSFDQKVEPQNLTPFINEFCSDFIKYLQENIGEPFSTMSVYILLKKNGIEQLEISKLIQFLEKNKILKKKGDKFIILDNLTNEILENILS